MNSVTPSDTNAMSRDIPDVSCPQVLGLRFLGAPTGWSSRLRAGPLARVPVTEISAPSAPRQPVKLGDAATGDGVGATTTEVGVTAGSSVSATAASNGPNIGDPQPVARSYPGPATQQSSASWGGVGLHTLAEPQPAAHDVVARRDVTEGMGTRVAADLVEQRIEEADVGPELLVHQRDHAREIRRGRGRACICPPPAPAAHRAIQRVGRGVGQQGDVGDGANVGGDAVPLLPAGLGEPAERAGVRSRSATTATGAGHRSHRTGGRRRRARGPGVVLQRPVVEDTRVDDGVGGVELQVRTSDRGHPRRAGGNCTDAAVPAPACRHALEPESPVAATTVTPAPAAVSSVDCTESMSGAVHSASQPPKLMETTVTGDPPVLEGSRVFDSAGPIWDRSVNGVPVVMTLRRLAPGAHRGQHLGVDVGLGAQTGHRSAVDRGYAVGRGDVQVRPRQVEAVGERVDVAGDHGFTDLQDSHVLARPGQAGAGDTECGGEWSGVKPSWRCPPGSWHCRACRTGWPRQASSVNRTADRSARIGCDRAVVQSTDGGDQPSQAGRYGQVTGGRGRPVAVALT